MDKKKVAIIFGGCSTEYVVSLKSAASVLEHLNKELYEILLIGITQKGVGSDTMVMWRIYEMTPGFQN